MKNTKGVLSVLLVFCILASALTVPAWAADPELGDGTAETTMWKSSDYLKPDSPVTENNPWSVETTNNADGTWQLVTGTTMTESAQPLFPTMPDGQQPTTGYISTGNYSGNWGKEGVNIAVNGKYMVPGSLWTSGDGANQAVAAKIAKVFIAPKAGKIRVSAAEGAILSNKLSWNHADLAWIVMKANGTEVWKKGAADRTEGSSYDMVTFDNQFIDVTEGEKIYFILQPPMYVSPTELACIWDPIIAYTNSVTDTDGFLSSKYLDPNVVYDENNPWSVEATNNASGVWETVTGTAMTASEQPLFPAMPDGQQPTAGYISTSATWGVGVNAAVNGKYMAPGSIWTGASGDDIKSTDAKIAKVFTAPKTGTIRISAVGGAILSNHITWAEDTMGWVVSKSDGTEIWKKGAADRTEGSSYDTATFDDQFIGVTEGEKIYFILQPQKWAIRAEQACIWDPAVEYGDFHVVSKAEYADDGTVTVSFDNVAANPGADAVIITAAYEGEVLLGCKLTKLSEITENKVSISNLVKKPDSVKILTWEFGADTKMKPLMDVISKTVTEAAAGE